MSRIRVETCRLVFICVIREIRGYILSFLRWPSPYTGGAVEDCLGRCAGAVLYRAAAFPLSTRAALRGCAFASSHSEHLTAAANSSASASDIRADELQIIRRDNFDSFARAPGDFGVIHNLLSCKLVASPFVVGLHAKVAKCAKPFAQPLKIFTRERKTGFP